MNHFSSHKNGRSMVSKPHQHEINKPPRQFCDYMNGIDNRFSEVSRLYLDGMSMDDVKYLRADDFISLVPEDQYRHKMIMTVMVRRYLYRHDDSCSSCSKNNINDSCSSCSKNNINNDRDNDRDNDKNNNRNKNKNGDYCHNSDISSNSSYHCPCNACALVDNGSDIRSNDNI